MQKLLSVAANFVFPTDVKTDHDEERADFLAEAKATYLDKDGVEFTMSTDDELEDAILQFFRGNQCGKKEVHSWTVSVTVHKDDCMLCPLLQEVVLGESTMTGSCLLLALSVAVILIKSYCVDALVSSRNGMLNLVINNGGDGM